jgi:hypothetical protein
MSRSIFKSKNIASASANNTNTNTNTNKRAPFCKVCADAGKTDTAHFPRQTPDPNSPVVCPTLLELQCRYCFQNGHTVKYCPVLKERDSLQQQQKTLCLPAQTPTRQPVARQQPVPRQSAQLPSPLPVVLTGRFQALLDDDDVASPVSPVTSVAAPVAEHFPALASKNAPTPPQGRAWAQMATNAALLPIPLPKNAVINSVVDDDDYETDESDHEDEEDAFKPSAPPFCQQLADSYAYISSYGSTCNSSNNYGWDDDSW